ncbi:MAG: hypothetical protein ACI94Y_001754 [Maribacter sp.]|jgi:hypothetical protein
MQPYEFKIVKIKPFKNMMLTKLVSESEIEDATNHLGAIGWNLVSTSEITHSGSTKEIVLFFSRPAQRLEEMV